MPPGHEQCFAHAQLRLKRDGLSHPHNSAGFAARKAYGRSGPGTHLEGQGIAGVHAAVDDVEGGHLRGGWWTDPGEGSKTWSGQGREPGASFDVKQDSSVPPQAAALASVCARTKRTKQCVRPLLTGRISLLLPARSAMCLYRGTPFSAAPACKLGGRGRGSSAAVTTRSHGTLQRGQHVM